VWEALGGARPIRVVARARAARAAKRLAGRSGSRADAPRRRFVAPEAESAKLKATAPTAVDCSSRRRSQLSAFSLQLRCKSQRSARPL